MTRRDPGPPRRLQDGSRVAYLEWIGEVKPAKRLGKKVGRGLPPASRAPPDASATPPATPTPPRPASHAPTRQAGGLLAADNWSKRHACTPAVPRRASALDRRKALTPLGHRRSRAGKLRPYQAASRPAPRASAGSSA